MALGATGMHFLAASLQTYDCLQCCVQVSIDGSPNLALAHLNVVGSHLNAGFGGDGGVGFGGVGGGGGLEHCSSHFDLSEMPPIDWTHCDTLLVWLCEHAQPSSQ